MSEFVIRVNLDLGGRWPRLGRCLLAGAMVFASVPELASESVTLTTYYPAPSGVYTQMITTGNTYLARDASSTAGQVIIGGSAAGSGQQLDVFSYMGSANNAAIRATYPNGGGLASTEFAALAHRSGFWSGLYANQGSASYAAYLSGNTLMSGNNLPSNATLTVNGGGLAGNYALTPGYQSWAYYGTGAGGAAVYNDNNSYKTLMLVGNNSNGGVRRVSVWDELNVNGNTYMNGTGYTSGGTYTPSSNVAYGSGSCYFSGYGAGPSSVICAGGYYVTLVGGFMSKYTIINSGQEPDGEALCCLCPAGLNVGYGGSCPAL